MPIARASPIRRPFFCSSWSSLASSDSTKLSKSFSYSSPRQQPVVDLMVRIGEQPHLHAQAGADVDGDAESFHDARFRSEKE